MTQKILFTGATDGIGLETVKTLAADGHHLLLHGRNAEKLKRVSAELSQDYPNANIESYIADLSDLNAVRKMAEDIKSNHDTLDAIVNNAGVYKVRDSSTAIGIDVRFVVNTIAPYLLTQALLPLLSKTTRVINLSSAAQSPVDLAAFRGERSLGDMPAYAQSKLAIAMWTQAMAKQYAQGPLFVSVNPGSLLATNMVREGFGTAGHDINIGVNILRDLLFNPGMEDNNGAYYDNDNRRWASISATTEQCEALIDVMEEIVARA